MNESYVDVKKLVILIHKFLKPLISKRLEAVSKKISPDPFNQNISKATSNFEHFQKQKHFILTFSSIVVTVSGSAGVSHLMC